MVASTALLRLDWTRIGVVGYWLDDDAVDVDCFFVSARRMREGIGRMLMAELTTRFGGRPIVTSTASANLPALNLSSSFGFEVESVDDALPGLSVTRLRRPPSERPDTV